MALRGGLLYRTAGRPGAADERLGWVPGDVVVRVTTLSAVTPVPGVRAPAAGIALAEGEVVTVLRVGDGGAPATVDEDGWPTPGADRAVLCDLGGERVALTGGTVVATGSFEEDAGLGGVVWRGRRAPELDVRALYARAEAATWAARAAGPRRGGGA
jgi:hypothetical protein